MMAPTFKTPIQRTGGDDGLNVLIDENTELICSTSGATDAELDFIVAAVNHYAKYLLSFTKT